MAKYKNFAELKINDFRAIKSADINLNGITVVSGINGCGKTTILEFAKEHCKDSVISINPDAISELIETYKDKTPACSKSLVEINAFIESRDLLNGKVYLDEAKNDFVYTNQHYSIVLNDASWNIKIFSLFYILLNKGYLNDKVLLIIEEPETHLHPQLMVEYAKLIVMLNAELGVKFLISSHNPDIVSSIKYISVVEGVLDSVNFYLAEKENEDDSQYTYKDCGDDIEPLFESFNKSYSKFDEYVYPEIFM